MLFIEIGHDFMSFYFKENGKRTMKGLAQFFSVVDGNNFSLRNASNDGNLTAGRNIRDISLVRELISEQSHEMNIKIFGVFHF